MSANELNVVTGGLGYTGGYIVRELLRRRLPVRTITNSTHLRNPFGGALEVRPMPFHDRAGLEDSLRGAAVLYNTYWVRFNHARFSHATAVDNTLRLFEAAARAGVRRVVHVSITNPSEDSPLEYFRGKARLERSLRETGLEWTILRPAVLFGGADILINNIAWMLRRFPAFGLFGDGGYRLQPIFVEDLARLAVEAGAARGANTLVNAIGPETFAFRDLVTTLGKIIGKPRPVVSISPRLGYLIGRIVGAAVGDVVVTREEIEGLMAGLLCVDDAPAGTTRLTDWARENAATLGVRYASELARRRRAGLRGAVPAAENGQLTNGG
jgi:NADH dehydrogenase